MTKKLTRGSKKASVASKALEKVKSLVGSKENEPKKVKEPKKAKVLEEKEVVKELSTAEKLVGTLHEGKKVIGAEEKILNGRKYVEVIREDSSTALI